MLAGVLVYAVSGIVRQAFGPRLGAVIDLFLYLVVASLTNWWLRRLRDG
jgi:hypothetical protein